ncbi:hypothetical protein [Candidatus Thiosymbion oneisti]|uniref:hypothetical protein n=1 Tax=Candidatus Thiosymbion oneisti TaxID=589554 RepID=UPI000B7CA19C|nr:hypothetical protein [Candidatus Thiosymbion oneisti]
MLTRSTKKVPLAVFFLAWLSSPFSGTVAASDNPVSIRQHPHIQHLISSLQLVVNEKARKNKNHFFIARYPATREYTYMLWREENVLWALGLDDSPTEYWCNVVQFFNSRDVIDLETGVVPTDEEVGTSTYLVSQPWVDSIVYDAVMNGDLIVIEKGKKPSKKSCNSGDYLIQ